MLDALTIKKITYFFTQRLFKPPQATQVNWEIRLGTSVPWARVWQIKSFFATPRDQVTWLKLMHRNLYLAPHAVLPNDSTCPLCSAHQNQRHLATCPAIENDMWLPLLDLFDRVGFPKPVNLTSFLLLGRIDHRTVVDRNQAGALFLAWRCLYSELVRGRIDSVRPSIPHAYLRTLTMLHTRLTRYGEKWLRWVRKNRGTGNKSYIPKRHQDKKWIQQTDDGIYAIHPALHGEIRRVRRYTADRFVQHV